MRELLVGCVIAIAAATATADPAPCADGDTCYARAKALEPRDPAAAFATYDRGCQLHHAMSCVGAAYLVRGDKLGKPDPDRAQQYFVMACGKKFEMPLACAMVALNLLRDVGGTGDHAKNIELATYALIKSCEGGSGFGCYNLGVIARDGVGMPADPKRAYVTFERACAAGEALGCREQGIALSSGSGAARDPTRAIALFEQACTAEPVTCYDLAHAYDKGIGVKADAPRARTLYAKACDGGEPVACYALALMIAGGRGGPQDDAAAHAWLAKACAGGLARACN